MTSNCVDSAPQTVCICAMRSRVYVGIEEIKKVDRVASERAKKVVDLSVLKKVLKRKILLK